MSAQAKRLTAEAPEIRLSAAAASIPETPCTIAMDTTCARMTECPAQPRWWIAIRSHTGRLLITERRLAVPWAPVAAARGSPEDFSAPYGASPRSFGLPWISSENANRMTPTTVAIAVKAYVQPCVSISQRNSGAKIIGPMPIAAQ